MKSVHDVLQFSGSAADYKEAAKAVSLAMGILRRSLTNPSEEDTAVMNSLHQNYLALLKQAMFREVPLRHESGSRNSQMAEQNCGGRGENSELRAG